METIQKYYNSNIEKSTDSLMQIMVNVASLSTVIIHFVRKSIICGQKNHNRPVIYCGLIILVAGTGFEPVTFGL